MSHKGNFKLFKSHWIEKGFLSRPLQLTLGFTIVPYGEYFSASVNLPQT